MITRRHTFALVPGLPIAQFLAKAIEDEEPVLAITTEVDESGFFYFADASPDAWTVRFVLGRKPLGLVREGQPPKWFISEREKKALFRKYGKPVTKP